MTESETRVIFDLGLRVGEVSGRVEEIKDHVGRVDQSVTNLETKVTSSFVSIERSIKTLSDKLTSQEAASGVRRDVRAGAWGAVVVVGGWAASYFSGGYDWLRRLFHG